MIRKAMPAIFVLAAIGLFYTFIDPTYTEVKGLREVEAKYDDALSKSKEFQRLKDELLTRYNAFPNEDIMRLKKLLPDNVDNIRLVLDLDGIASAYGMRIKDLNVAESGGSRGGEEALGPQSDPFESVRISFSVAAEYQTIVAFLADLERSLRVVDVAEFEFQEGDGDLTEYKVVLETYWLR